MIDAPQETLQQALTLHRSGDLQQAAELYEQLLERREDNPVLQHLAGTLRLQQREYLSAIEHLTIAIRLAPDDSQSHNNLGVAHQSLGQWEAAARSYETTIKLDPSNGSALFNLARVMSERGLHRDAVKCLQRAVEAEPNNHELKLALIDELIADEDWPAAEELIRTCQDIQAADSAQYDLAVRMALLQLQQGQLQEADRLYEQLICQNPEDVEQLNNRAVVCEQLGRLDAARETILRAIQLRPDIAEPRVTLGIIERSLGHFPAALEAWQQALELSDNSQARLNLATTRLLLGDDHPGLTELPAGDRGPQPAGAMWAQGTPPGGRLLLIADSEPAECLLFGRWIRQLKTLGFEHVALAIPIAADQLAAWRERLQPQSPVDELIAWDECTAWKDQWLPLSRLPALLNCDGPGTAFEWSNLVIPEAAAARASARAQGGSLQVGLIWHSLPEQRPDNVRCCPVQWMEQLLNLTCCEWSVLSSPQPIESVARHGNSAYPVAVGANRVKTELAHVNDRRPYLRTLEDWIEAWRGLDLIVGVDGPIVRCAAAWGCPTYALLPKIPHWSWRLDDSVAPWYPRAKAYRQSEWHAWQAPVESLARDLENLAVGET